MQNSQAQLLITIVAVILVLLFLGFLFVLMLLYYSNKKKQMRREQESLKDSFDKQLLQSKLEIQEQTFNMISEEIHDNVGQLMSLAKIQVHIIEQRNDANKELVGELKQTISKAMSDLRDLSKGLNSERIKVFSLADSVSQELDRINKSGFIKAVFSQEGDDIRIPEQKKLILFRIIQEGLQNILKHANASEMQITFISEPELLHVCIRDNGVGFDTAAKTGKNSGLGLNNMINRAKLIGGNISVSSSTGQGTSLNIHIPYA